MNGVIRKASAWKRGSAFFCDLVLLAMLVITLALAFSSIFGYERYNARMMEIYDKYATEYGIDLELTAEEIAALPQEQKDAYEAADQALLSDAEAIYVHSMMSSLRLLIAMLSVAISFVLLEFVVPLVLGNGQSLGKKVFGLAVMRSNSVKISTTALFVRTVLGKYTIETMVPVLMLMMLFEGAVGFTGLIVILGLFILQLCLIIFTKNRTAIHDLLSDCVTVDKSSQMIFESEEAKTEYQKRLHAEMVQKDNY